MHLQDAAIATSGDYRIGQDWRQNFKPHNDPRRGGPLQNDVASVSVITDRCITADAWPRRFMVMGSEAGLHVAAAKGLNALFIVRQGQQPAGYFRRPIFEGEHA